MSKRVETVPEQLQQAINVLTCALSHPPLPSGTHAFNPSAKLVPNVQEVYPPLFELYSKFPESAAFREPVNAVELGIYNYYTVITEPMSLRDVLDRLEQGDYSNDSQVLDDVQKIWRNCVLFNGPDSLLAKSAQKCDAQLKQSIQKRRDDALAPTAEQEKLLNRVHDLSAFDDGRIVEEVIHLLEKIQPSSLIDGEVEFQLLTLGSIRKLKEFMDSYETQSGSNSRKRGRNTPAIS